MTGLTFNVHAPALTVAPNRSDVACFVGAISRRLEPTATSGTDGSSPPTFVPAAIRRWLRSQGWMAAAADDRAALIQVPVPIESWDAFTSLFAWESRPIAFGATTTIPTYLGAAVRSFFAQGGRRCYIIATGAPWPVLLPSESDYSSYHHSTALP